MKKSDFTVEKLREMNLGIDQAYDVMLELKGRRPQLKREGKPGRKLPETPEAYRAYAAELESFDDAKEQWKKDVDLYQEERSQLLEVYNDFAATHYSLETIPAKYRKRIWKFAWKMGHNQGIGEVKGILKELTKIFK